MKKVLSALCIVALASLVLVQVGHSQMMFKKGDNMISAGLGIGLVGLYGSSSLPPIFAGFEHGFTENISAGGFAAYAGSSEEFPHGKWKYSYIVIAGRGAYHFDLKQKNIDPYAGLSLGYTVVSSSVEERQVTGFNFSASGSYVFWGFFVGGRYYFTPKLAAMAELGYEIGFIKVGVTYKL